MKEGDLVEWQYKHWLNSKSYTIIAKRGILLEFVSKVKNVRHVAGSHTKVHFEGNKHPSIVSTKELKLIESRPKLLIR